jgi:hypothetical protein
MHVHLVLNMTFPSIGEGQGEEGEVFLNNLLIPSFSYGLKRINPKFET